MKDEKCQLVPGGIQAPAHRYRDWGSIPACLFKNLTCFTCLHNTRLAGCTDGANVNLSCLWSDVQPQPELMVLILYLWPLLSAKRDKDSIMVNPEG